MPQYMLSVHHSPDEVFPEDFDFQPVFEAVERFNAEVKEAGAWVFAGGLQPIEMTTTVDGRDERAMVVDGPFAESKEYLGGFWVIEAADLDAALAWATKGSAACQGKVEVRPFQDEPA